MMAWPSAAWGRTDKKSTKGVSKKFARADFTFICMSKKTGTSGSKTHPSSLFVHGRAGQHKDLRAHTHTYILHTSRQRLANLTRCRHASLPFPPPWTNDAHSAEQEMQQR